VIAVVFVSIYLLSAAGLVDIETVKESVSNGLIDLQEKKDKHGTPVAALMVGGIMTLCVATCMPFTLFVEYFAGFLLQLQLGVFVVAVAKTVAAGITFLLARYLLRAYVMKTFGKNMYMKNLAQNSEESGWQLVVSMRLSPAPSYIVNYGIAVVTDMDFQTFMLSTLGANVPFVAFNVWCGTLVKDVTKLFADKATREGNMDAEALAAKDFVFNIISMVMTAAAIASMVIAVRMVSKKK
jgi:uncharacterized membrane protein YdjX (TVP38/TMEM64 family)